MNKLSQLEEAAYHRLLEQAEVKQALFAVECVQDKRDSVSRKLCAGSTAVTVDDLARLEGELLNAKAALVELAEQMPLLKKHPMLSAVGTNS